MVLYDLTVPKLYETVVITTNECNLENANFEPFFSSRTMMKDNLTYTKHLQFWGSHETLIRRCVHGRHDLTRSSYLCEGETRLQALETDLLRFFLQLPCQKLRSFRSVKCLSVMLISHLTREFS